MTNYLKYKRDVVALDADDIESWITVRGNHIPIKKGQSKEEAVKSFLESKGGNASAKGSNQKNELSIAYHKEKGHIKEGRPPKDWTKVEGGTTAPNGYSWYSNNKSMFGGKRESYLYKDENKEDSVKLANQIKKGETILHNGKKFKVIQADKNWVIGIDPKGNQIKINVEKYTGTIKTENKASKQDIYADINEIDFSKLTKEDKQNIETAWRQSWAWYGPDNDLTVRWRRKVERIEENDKDQ